MSKLKTLTVLVDQSILETASRIHAHLFEQIKTDAFNESDDVISTMLAIGQPDNTNGDYIMKQTFNKESLFKLYAEWVYSHFKETYKVIETNEASQFLIRMYNILKDPKDKNHHIVSNEMRKYIKEVLSPLQERLYKKMIREYVDLHKSVIAYIFFFHFNMAYNNKARDIQDMSIYIDPSLPISKEIMKNINSYMYNYTFSSMLKVDESSCDAIPLLLLDQLYDLSIFWLNKYISSWFSPKYMHDQLFTHYLKACFAIELTFNDGTKELLISPKNSISCGNGRYTFYVISQSDMIGIDHYMKIFDIPEDFIEYGSSIAQQKACKCKETEHKNLMKKAVKLFNEKAYAPLIQFYSNPYNDRIIVDREKELKYYLGKASNMEKDDVLKTEYHDIQYKLKEVCATLIRQAYKRQYDKIKEFGLNRRHFINKSNLLSYGITVPEEYINMLNSILNIHYLSLNSNEEYLSIVIHTRCMLNMYLNGVKDSIGQKFIGCSYKYDLNLTTLDSAGRIDNDEKSYINTEWYSTIMDRHVIGNAHDSPYRFDSYNHEEKAEAVKGILDSYGKLFHSIIDTVKQPIVDTIHAIYPMKGYTIEDFGLNIEEEVIEVKDIPQDRKYEQNIVTYNGSLVDFYTQAKYYFDENDKIKKNFIPLMYIKGSDITFAENIVKYQDSDKFVDKLLSITNEEEIKGSIYQYLFGKEES